MRKKIHFYKRALQLTLLINGFFIAVGIVALYRYLAVNDVLALHLVIVAIGVLLFGVAVPAYIFKRVAEMRGALRKQTEETITRLVAAWIESYEEVDGDIFHDPLFWVNILLTIVEVFGENSKHPAAVTLIEFIPIIKQEIKNARKPKKKKSKTKAEVTDE
jgi:hypothetical protein